MATPRTSLDVPPTPEVQPFIAARVASGQHRTTGEAVRATLRSPERTETRGDWPAREGEPLHPERA